jgi:hypothetical protein
MHIDYIQSFAVQINSAAEYFLDFYNLVLNFSDENELFWPYNGVCDGGEDAALELQQSRTRSSSSRDTVGHCIDLSEARGKF